MLRAAGGNPNEIIFRLGLERDPRAKAALADTAKDAAAVQDSILARARKNQRAETDGAIAELRNRRRQERAIREEDARDEAMRIRDGERVRREQHRSMMQQQREQKQIITQAEAEKRREMERTAAVTRAHHQQMITGFKQMASGALSAGRAILIMGIATEDSLEKALRNFAKFEAVAHGIVGAVNMAQGAWKGLGALGVGGGMRGGAIAGAAGVAGLAMLGERFSGADAWLSVLNGGRHRGQEQYDATQQAYALADARNSSSRFRTDRDMRGILSGADVALASDSMSTASASDRMAALNRALGQGTFASNAYAQTGDLAYRRNDATGIQGSIDTARGRMQLAMRGRSETGDLLSTQGGLDEAAAAARDVAQLEESKLQILMRQLDIKKQERDVARETGERSVEAALRTAQEMRGVLQTERERLEMVREQTKTVYERYADADPATRAKYEAVARKVERGEDLNAEDRRYAREVGLGREASESAVREATRAGIGGMALGRVFANKVSEQEAMVADTEALASSANEVAQRMKDKLKDDLTATFDPLMKMIQEAIDAAVKSSAAANLNAANLDANARRAAQAQTNAATR